MDRDTEPVSGKPEWDDDEPDTALEVPWHISLDKRGNCALWLCAPLEGTPEREPDAWVVSGRLHVGGFGVRTLPAKAVSELLRCAEAL